VGEYRDALGVLVPSEESRVLVEEGYRAVGVKKGRDWGMTVIREFQFL